MSTNILPDLDPLFHRLAALHTDWDYRIGPQYKNGTNWCYTNGAVRDADWMRSHLKLTECIISTIAEAGWAYNIGYAPAIGERWAEVRRGRLENEDERDEVWISYGPPHRAYGLTDLHALTAALVEALEAHRKQYPAAFQKVGL